MIDLKTRTKYLSLITQNRGTVLLLVPPTISPSSSQSTQRQVREVTDQISKLVSKGSKDGKTVLVSITTHDPI